PPPQRTPSPVTRSVAAADTRTRPTPCGTPAPTGSPRASTGTAPPPSSVTADPLLIRSVPRPPASEHATGGRYSRGPWRTRTFPTPASATTTAPPTPG